MPDPSEEVDVLVAGFEGSSVGVGEGACVVFVLVGEEVEEEEDKQESSVPSKTKKVSDMKRLPVSGMAASIAYAPAGTFTGDQEKEPCSLRWPSMRVRT